MSSPNIRLLPPWYDDAKFGIFVHWGIYSVPAFADPRPSPRDIDRAGAEWYWKKLIVPGRDDSATLNYHLQEYCSDSRRNFRTKVELKRDYKNFAAGFTAESFDPNEWAKLFQASGARYVVLTSKHHDGWCNWPTQLSEPGWNSGVAGPRRDLVGDLSSAVTSLGLRMGLYFSLSEWFHPLFLSDKRKKGQRTGMTEFPDRVVLPQLRELVTQYRPSLIWSDGDWTRNHRYWKSAEFLQWLYSQSPVRDEVVVNSRWGGLGPEQHCGFLSRTDRWHPGAVISEKWENCFTIGTSWGYNANHPDELYQSPSEILQLLVRTVAFGGNFLLNVGPKADGTIPEVFVTRLRLLGDWLRVNGEAIYATKPWIVQQEPEKKIWFTCAKTEEPFVYALCCLPLSGRKIRLTSIQSDGPSNVVLLGVSGEESGLQWEETETAIEIELRLAEEQPEFDRLDMVVLKMSGMKERL